MWFRPLTWLMLAAFAGASFSPFMTGQVSVDLDASLSPSSPDTVLPLAPTVISLSHSSKLVLITEALHVDAGEQKPPSSSEDGRADLVAAARSHSWQPLQATSLFTFERLTDVAPWSNRIQPAMLYRDRGLTYTQVNTGINISVSAGALLMFEGGFGATLNGAPVVENDVWVSADDGRTWDLIGGRSAFGRSGSVTAANAATFVGRSGSNNCADPVSSIVFSIGGNAGGMPTSSVYRSTDGQTWTQQGTTFSPPRFFSSCDVDESGHVFVIGGNSVVNGRSVLLNDVWQASARSGGGQWRRLTDAAPFSGREEHLVLIANSPVLKREIIYVIGGEVVCLNVDCSDSRDGNDVWASSDNGASWAVISATPPFKGRWGHGGVVSSRGVLVMWGGSTSDDGRYNNTYTFREAWASFDGGYTWQGCNLPPALEDRLFIRTEQGAALNLRGQLVISAGYAYAERGQFQVRYRDVWRSTFSVDDTRELAERCGGASAVPAVGPGLRRWPGVTPTSSSTTLNFSPLTRRAPWSPRIQPAFLLMNQSRTYTSAVDGTTASTGSNWLLMYEGSLISTYTPNSNENDVWGSGDHGATWSLISGVARQSIHGYKESAHPDASFHSRAGAGNCEDPRTDDVFSVGGGYYLSDGTRVETSDTWHSTDAIHWTLRTGRSFTPARHFLSCDVDSQSQLFLVGGGYFDEAQPGGTLYLQDIWTSISMGQSWTRLTARAAFPARAEHVLQIARSDVYDVDLLYVAGGFTTGGDTLNDVWVSSNAAVTWKQLTARAAWAKRWGHGAAITAVGVMLVIGGTSPSSTGTGNSFADMWASFNGGVRWSSCRLPVGGSFIRGEQAVALTADEHLVLGTGYQYINNGRQRIDYSDLWISDSSIADPNTLARICAAVVPEEGVGLRDVDGWLVPSGDEGGSISDGGSGSVGVVALVVVLVLVAAAVVAWISYRIYRRGHWNPFTKEVSSSSTLDAHPFILSAEPGAHSLTTTHDSL